MERNDYSYHYQQAQKFNEDLKAKLDKLPYFCKEYVAEKRMTDKLQSGTYNAYMSDILFFFKYLCANHENFTNTNTTDITSIQLNTLTQSDITAYVNYLCGYEKNEVFVKNSESGIARKLAAIRSMFHYLVSRNLMYYNVAEMAVTPVTKQTDIIYMDTEQREHFLNVLEEGFYMTEAGKVLQYQPGNKYLIRDTAIIYLLLGTGIRVSELVGLDLFDINFREHSVLIYRKGDNEQKLYFSSDVESKLMDYIDFARAEFLHQTDNIGVEETALFISTHKKRLDIRTIQLMIKKYADYAFGPNSDKKITPQKLRNTYAASLLEATKDPILVADVLGHENLSMVSKYVKVQNRKRAAISVT